jgi:hypothetical protein
MKPTVKINVIHAAPEVLRYKSKKTGQDEEIPLVKVKGISEGDVYCVRVMCPRNVSAIEFAKRKFGGEMLLTVRQCSERDGIFDVTGDLS